MNDLTPAQERFLEDNTQFSLDAVLDDGSMFVRTSGNSLTKVPAETITQHMNSVGLREEGLKANPYQPTSAQLEQNYTRQLEVGKIANMLQTIKANSLSGDTYGSVDEIKNNPKLYEKLHKEYGNIVSSNGGY